METAQRSLTDQFQQVQRRAQQLMESMNIPGAPSLCRSLGASCQLQAYRLPESMLFTAWCFASFHAASSRVFKCTVEIGLRSAQRQHPERRPHTAASHAASCKNTCVA